MHIVSDFLGLSAHNWEDVSIISRNTLSTNHDETLADIPGDPRAVERVHAFYAAHTTRYYDAARAHGFTGCRPDQ